MAEHSGPPGNRPAGVARREPASTAGSVAAASGARVAANTDGTDADRENRAGSDVEVKLGTEAGGGGSVRAIKPVEVLRDPDQEWSVQTASIDYEDPLITCLSILSALLQRPISTQALKTGLPLVNNRFTPELCIRAADRAGLNARLVHRPKISDIAPVTLPCLLLLKDRGACVLLSTTRDGKAEIAIAEGGGGTQTITAKELEESYTGYAIFARPRFKFDARASRIELSEKRPWFWGTLFKFWPIYSHVFLASVLINLFVLASPLFIMNVYDRVVPNNAVETLWVLATGVLTVFTFEFVMRNLRSYFVDMAGKNADVIIASNLLSHILAMRLDQKPPSTGALAAHVREFESLRDFFTSGTLVFFVDLPFIFLFIGVIWLVGGPLAYIPLIAVPIVMLVGGILQFPLLRVVERTHRETTQKNAILIEAIDGLETIKSTAAESRVQGQWERAVGMTAESSGKARTISTFATTFASVAVQMTTIFVVVFGVYQISAGELTMGALVACTILTGRSLAPLGAIAGLATRFQTSRVALKALDELMKRPVERSPDKTFLHVPVLTGAIEVRDVSFAYPGQEGRALDGASLRIRAGERVGILGRIGSGKSTLGRLLIGLYDPADGAILFDGMDRRQIDPADLRRNIGYAAQDNYLFFGTVRDNIAFGAPHVDDEAILRAAKIAGVHDFLRRHPHGFDLQVGERGMGLSGGQRQAIAIARALLPDPPILLLDEPTSNMDNASETRFRQRLVQSLSGKTLVMITHRSSLLDLVDRLIIVDGGKVIANGAKEDVLKALKQGKIKTIQ